jgi:signal transduction histidine kinase
MVEQVLSFAGVHSGLKARSFTSVDLSKVLEQAINGLEIPIRENGFSIERDIPQNLPPIMGDPVSLTRALQNLIGNALKYGAAGRWIGISVVAGPRTLTLAIQDRGSGILSSDLPHIFDPFYRGRTAIEGQIQGSGLGLSIVKQVVESHGGRIEVSSSFGVGSTFSITLPLAHAAETE